MSSFYRIPDFNSRQYSLIVIMLLLISSNLTHAQQVQGFFIEDWNPKSIDIPDYLEKNQPVVEPDVIVTFDVTDTLAKVSPYIFGNNANTYSTIMHNNSRLVNHIKDLNPKVLRYPGGSLSNEFFWDLEANKTPSDIPSGMNVWRGMDQSAWTMSVNNYYKFLDSVNSTGIICVNYSYARYGLSDDPVAQAAHYAAEWVRYDNGRTKFWEIGNENFGNWEQGYLIDTTLNKDGQPQKINGELYGKHCRVFIDSMKAAAAEIGSSIYIGVQAFEAESSWDAVQTNWNELMMPVIADKADFYIIHNYYTNYNENSGAKTILNTYNKSNHFKSAVLKDLAEAGYGPAPIALTEWNIFAVGSKQQVSHINGIHSVLVTGELIKDQYGLATRWNLANGWSKGDDHGTFSQGNEPGVPRFEPRPVFYYLTFLQRNFGDVMVESSVTGSNDIVCFASLFENGPAGIVIVNKGSESKTVGIESEQFVPGNRFYWYELKGGTMDGGFSRQVVINEQTSDLVAGGPSNYNDIPAWSAETTQGMKINAAPFSVNFILLENVRTSATDVDDNSSDAVFDVSPGFPNPFKVSTTMSYLIKKQAHVRVKIYSITGQLIKILEDSDKEPGSYQLVWNGKNEKGIQVQSGVYFCRFTFTTLDGKYSGSEKMSLLRSF